MNWKIGPVGLALALAIASLAVGPTIGKTALQEQSQEPLPIGLTLSSEMENLIAERLERIHELILDYELNKTEQHEEKLRLILENHERVREDIGQWQLEFLELVQRFENGSVSEAEFKVERERLRLRLQEATRLCEHLNQRFMEGPQGSQNDTTGLGQQISAINQEISQETRELHLELQTERKGPGKGDSGQGNGGSPGKGGSDEGDPGQGNGHGNPGK